MHLALGLHATHFSLRVYARTIPKHIGVNVDNGVQMDFGARIAEARELMNSGEVLTDDQRLNLLNGTYDLALIKVAECAANSKSKFSSTALNLMRETRNEINEIQGPRVPRVVKIQFDLGLDEEAEENEAES